MVLLLLLFFILGSAIGSFLNVLIDRSVEGQSLMGRSRCDYCRMKLTAVDLVPIFSFLVLGGRCRKCKKSLSLQYPVVEGLSGLLFVLSFWNWIQTGSLSLIFLIFSLLIAAILLVVAVFDFKFSLIPTSYLYFASIIALFYNYFSLNSSEFVLRVAAGFCAAAFFILIILVTRGRGMGEGDIPLAFLIGLILGPMNGLVAFFVAFLTGALIALFLVAMKFKKFGQAVPFAPFLIFGFFCSFFWAPFLIRWYLMLY